MKKITLEGSPKTPSIVCDPDTASLEVVGRSIPENSVEFYRPLLDWLDDYTPKAGVMTNVKIQLEYFNTSSSKCILDFFKKLETLHKKGNQVTIHWCYEADDEDMKEAGEDYEAIVQIPFKVQQI